MTAKTKGRPLLPLLPLEYCSIGRAARMLDCEPEDLLHWGAIGAIDLTYKFGPQNDYDFFETEIKKSHIAWMLNNGSVIDLRPFAEGWSWQNGEQTIIVDFTSAYKGNIENLETDLKLVMTGKDPSCTMWAKLSITGFFPILAASLSDLETCADFNGFAIEVKIDPNDESVLLFNNSRLNTGKLLIDKDNLLKVYNAITSGQSLKNKLNDTDVAKSIAKSSELYATVKQERLTGGISKVVLALTELVLKQADEDSNLINSPHKLYERINQLLLKHKVNPECSYYVGVSDNGFRDIIAKARSAQQNEKK